MRRRPPALAAALLLAACAAAEPPVAATPEVAPSAPAAATGIGDGEEGAAVPGDPFCGALARIVDAEPEGFLGLRAAPAEARQWNGSLVPAGFGDCWIEDGGSVGAAYACSGRVIGAGVPDAPASSYLDLAAAIDACLVLPIWYPLAWQREPDRATARGGHEAAWQAGGGPRITLALDQHPERVLWFVRLRVAPGTGPQS